MAGNDYSTIWANGDNIQALWNKIKAGFVGGLWDQTGYTAAWKTQARANLDLAFSTFHDSFWAGRAKADEKGNNLLTTYAHSMAFNTINGATYLTLYDNSYNGSTPSAVSLSNIAVNQSSGLLRLDGSGKIPLVHIPDSIAGQLLYAGTVSSNGVCALTDNAKTKWGIQSLTITASNYSSYQGAYFIASADFDSTRNAYIYYDQSYSGDKTVLVGDWVVATSLGWMKVDNTDAVRTISGVRDSYISPAPGTKGDVVMTAQRVGALDLYLPNTTQSVQGKVEFEKDIWSLGGVGAYGISDLSMGGGGGGGLSGSILRDWVNFNPNDETQILGSNLGIEAFQMSGSKMQFKRNGGWVDAFTLGQGNIPNLELTQINSTEELQKIQTLSATGTPSGFLKRASNGTWSFDTNSYALASALNDYVTKATAQTITGAKKFQSVDFGAALEVNRNAALASGIKFSNTNGSLGYIGFDAQGRLLAYNSDHSAGYEIWHEGNDGSGSGLDADTLDGYEASTFVKYDAGADEQTIKSSIASLSKGVINLWRNSGDHYTFLGFSNGTTETYLGGIGFKSQSDHNLYRKDSFNYYKIWDENNDGSGSGLDADKLDGNDSSYFQPKVSALGSTTKPIYTSAAGTFAECSTYAGGTAVTLNGTSKAASTASFYAPTGAGTSGQILKSTAGAPEWINQSALVAGKATQLETQRSIWGQNFNGSANVTGAMSSVTNINSLLYFGTGKIGIGVSSPTKALDISGDIQATGNIQSTAGGMSAAGIADLSMGGGTGGSGTVTALKINTHTPISPNVDTGIITLNVLEGDNDGTIKVDGENISVHGLGNLAFLSDYGLSDLTGATEVNKIETLATGSAAGLLKRASNGTWSFDTNTYALNSALADYVTLATAQIITGTKTFQSDGFGGALVVKRNHSANAAAIQFVNNSGIKGYLGYLNDGTLATWTGDTTNSYKIWHAGNDGAGSTLDADLLDGKHASELFTTLENDNEQLSATIGTTNKKLTIGYATKALRMKQESKPNQEFTYRVCPKTIDVDSVKLDRIKGKTLIWNQMITKLSAGTSTSNGVTMTVDATGKITLSGTASAQAEFRPWSPVSISGHKYFVSSPGLSNLGRSGIYLMWDFSNAQDVPRDTIITAVQSGDYPLVIRIPSGFVCNNVVLEPNIIDLTLAFGEGNEPSVAEFRKLYQNYYSPNSGQHINNSAKAIECVGFNLWDEEYYAGGINITDGETPTTWDGISAKHKMPVFPSTQYYVGSGKVRAVLYYDVNGRYITYEITSGVTSVTTPANCYYIRLTSESTYGSVYHNDICINKYDASKNGTYEPYKRVVTELGLDEIKVKSPNIWDEEWESKKTINNNGEVVDTNGYLISKNFIEVKPNTTYYFKSASALYAYEYDKNGVKIGWLNATNNNNCQNLALTTKANTAYLKFMRYGETLTANDICINKSDAAFNGRYFPHGVLTFNGIDGVGGGTDYEDTFDEIIGNKLIKRYKTFTITSNTSISLFNITYRDNGFVGISTDDTKPDGNVISTRYTGTHAPSIGQQIDKSLRLPPVGAFLHQIGLKDTSLITSNSSQTDVRNALIGTTIIYELEYPETYELVEPIPMSLPSGTTERRLPEDTQDSVIAPFSADMTYGTNNGDILASAIPWERIGGRPTIDKGHGADGSWFTVNIGGQTLYIRFNTKGASATNGPGFELEISDSPDPNEQTEDYTKSFAFGTLSTDDINTICV